MNTALLVEAVAGGVCAWFIVLWIEKTAHQREWLDRPNQRSSHARPTPRGGGLAIVLVTIVGSVVVLVARGRLTTGWSAVLGAASAIAAVSWIDDLHSVPNRIRLAIHLTAAAVAVLVMAPIREVGFPRLGTISIAILAIPLTMLWIAGLTNVYNFMDGIDGIAGLQAVVAGAGWAAIGALVPNPEVLTIATLLAVSAFAFLLLNWSPARIFMGDVGSAFIGYLLAVFALANPENHWLPFAAALSVWPFLFDGTFTLVRRFVRGENVTVAHNSHLYQRLVRAGWSHGRVAAIYGALAVMGVLFAVAAVLEMPEAGLVYVAIPLAATLLWGLVVGMERRSKLNSAESEPTTSH